MVLGPHRRGFARSSAPRRAPQQPLLAPICIVFCALKKLLTNGEKSAGGPQAWDRKTGPCT
jgi:hypothetical protein